MIRVCSTTKLEVEKKWSETVNIIMLTTQLSNISKVTASTPMLSRFCCAKEKQPKGEKDGGLQTRTIRLISFAKR